MFTKQEAQWMLNALLSMQVNTTLGGLVQGTKPDQSVVDILEKLKELAEDKGESKDE